MRVVRVNTRTSPPDCCIISLASGRSSYIQALARLEQSLSRVGFQGDFLGWSDELPEGSPSQLEAPMAFKTFCFREAQRRGYRFVIWMDAPIVAIRSLTPVLAKLRANGYVMFTNNYGQSLGQWSSDETLAHHNIDREAALSIPEVPTSVIGLDLGSRLGSDFLERWHSICTDGLTCRGRREPYRSAADHYAVAWNKDCCISSDPRVGGHRFDQTAAGIVAHQLGMTPYADELRDIHYQALPVNRSTALLHHREFSDTITPLDQIYRRVFVDDPYILPLMSFTSRLKRLAKRIITTGNVGI